MFFSSYINFLFIPQQEILANKNILKVGVASYNDADYLLKDYRIHTVSTFDLRFMAVLADCKPGALAKMSDDYLGIKLDKQSQTHSGWEADFLSASQTKYAAEDAEVGIKLFKYFANEIKPVGSFESPKAHLQYIIQEYCSKFYDTFYDGSQGIPFDFIKYRMSNY